MTQTTTQPTRQTRRGHGAPYRHPDRSPADRGSAPRQLRRRDPAARGDRGRPGPGRVCLRRRSARAQQPPRPRCAARALPAARRRIARLRPRPPERPPVPPEPGARRRQDGRPAEQRRRQGAAQPRPRLQGRGGRQRRGRPRPRPRCEHGPVQLSGAHGRRHPRARRRRGAGGRRPGAASGDRHRPRPAVLAQLPARRAARAAGAHRRGDRDDPRPGRPQDEQVLRQHHHADGGAGRS